MIARRTRVAGYCPRRPGAIFSRAQPFNRRIAMATRILALSSADAGYFGLLRDMVLSVTQQPGLPELEFAFFDLGLTQPQRDWLRGHSDRILTPRQHFDVP